MKLVVGLGNPGRRYAETRHNVGFKVVEAFARENAVRWKRSWRFPAHLAKLSAFGSEILLVKPRTYMNRSGEAVGALTRRFSISPDEVIVAVDDVELACGRIRVRPKGGSGGHNGLKSISEALGTDAYPRIRVGVGPKPVRDDMIEFVLSDFAAAECALVRAAVERSANAIQSLLEQGMEKTMNTFNERKN